jgi:hypothetical protein
MLKCKCGKQFLNRQGISSHISALSRSQPNSSHFALRDDHDSATVVAVPLPTGINAAAAPPLVSAAVLHNDVNNEVDVTVADDDYNDNNAGSCYGEDVDSSPMHDSVNTDPSATPIGNAHSH